MAYPPPVQATNRTNATPQLDTHAADHNSNGLAINDIVAHVQAQDAANASALNGKVGPSVTTAPYAGTWGDGVIKVRAGHVGLTTDAYGLGTVSFLSPFPAGLIAVTVTPVGDMSVAGVSAWWPFTQILGVGGFYIWAFSPDGWQGAGGHPPAKGTIWTLASQPISFDYIALGT